MYQPKHFEESRIEVLRRLIEIHPLGTLVAQTPKGLDANHLPFLHDPAPAPFGTLRAHVARANPVWQEFSKEAEVLAIFQGPQAYVTPSWYWTKQQNGKVVPTYNYMVVHAYGRMRAIEDPEWLRRLVTNLTEKFEIKRPVPWKPMDAPADFIEAQLRAIVGIEIPVARIHGKWKLSQNRLPVDRAGVVRGLGESEGAEARAMAQLMKEREP